MITKKSLSFLACVAICLFTIAFIAISQTPEIAPPQAIDALNTSNEAQEYLVATSPAQSIPQKKPTLLVSQVTFDNYESALGPLPKSLRGTRIPASFQLGPEGHLIVTPSIKSVIEYFLSANGEESIETIVARIEEFFTQQLQEPARSEALDVLAQYIGYKESLITLEENLAENTKLSGKSSDYLTMFQYRREARMNSLSPEIYDAFFADEDKADSYTAGLLEIRKNTDLSDEEKASQMLAIEQYLPPQEQKIKQAEHTREKLKQNIEIARSSGASNEDIFQMRSEVYDYETAERFAAADKKKFEWDARFEVYRQERQSILINDGLSTSDKANEIANLQSKHFNPKEKLRLATLDQLADKKAKL